MTLDQRAHNAAANLRDGLDTIAVPEPGAVVRRARRRRRVSASATALVVVAALVATFAVVGGNDTPKRVEVSGSQRQGLPAGAAVEGAWTRIPKVSSGIGSGASLNSLTSDGSSLLLGGERPGGGGKVVTMWWSDDGVRWTEAAHPTAHESVTAIGTHAGTAIAIGAPGGANGFVWRSQDHGRHWEEIARGELFGASVPNSRPGAIVDGVLWHGGWWIAYGGAADGYEGIWVSRDAVQWRLALDSRSSGSVDGIVETADGSLMAYGVGSTPSRSTVELGWFTKDPTAWGASVPIATPGRNYLESVTRGAKLALGSNIDKYGLATPVLHSADGGHTWTQDSTFSSRFPTVWAWAATTTAGIDVVAGTTIETNQPKAWLSSGGNSWVSGPLDPAPPTLPTTSIPYIPPKGALSLVASVGNRIVMMGLAADLDRYYTFDVQATPPDSAPVATERTVPGLAAVMQRVQNFEYDGPVSYAEVVATTRDKLYGLFGGPQKLNTSPVYLVRMVGRFVCNECSRPPGASVQRGNQILLIVPRGASLGLSGVGAFGIGDGSTDLSQFGTVYRLSSR